MHRTTFRALKVTSRVATPGAESAVYDCLVFTVLVQRPRRATRQLACHSHFGTRSTAWAAIVVLIHAESYILKKLQK